MTRVRILVGVVIGVLVAALTVAPASAEEAGPEQVDPQVAAMLEEVPGGIVLAPDHAIWPELDMELIVPSTDGLSLRTASVGSCSSGLICAYSGYTRSGAMLTFGTCGIHYIPVSFTMRSLANARSSGYAQARYGTSVVAVAYAGSWANVYGATTNIRCVF